MLRNFSFFGLCLFVCLPIALPEKMSLGQVIPFEHHRIYMRVAMVFVVLYCYFSVELVNKLGTVIQRKLQSPDPVSNHGTQRNTLVDYMYHKKL